MKRSFKLFFACILTVCLILSFSSCSLFDTMREYSKKASEITILPTPEDKDIYSEFNSALEKSIADSKKMAFSSEYSVNEIEVKKGEEKADLLNKAAGTLNKLIFANDPGKQSGDLTDLTGTLLENFDNTSSLSFTAERNKVMESVTNEKGEEATDEEGNVIKEEKIKDNIVTIDFLFYNDEILEEAGTDEEGNEVTAVTERSFADVDAIENVFGGTADKEAVLAQFDCIKDYFIVEDYSIEYDACKVSSALDLDTNHLSGVTFEKTMLVSAKVTGIGVFAETGEVTFSFKVIKTDNYSFEFAIEE